MSSAGSPQLLEALIVVLGDDPGSLSLPGSGDYERDNGSYFMVYTELEKHGIKVTGGRVGRIGVADFILGGGLPMFPSGSGFACDSVIEFKMVQASEDENSNLWIALKGGLNTFVHATQPLYHFTETYILIKLAFITRFTVIGFKCFIYELKNWSFGITTGELGQSRRQHHGHSSLGGPTVCHLDQPVLDTTSGRQHASLQLFADLRRLASEKGLLHRYVFTNYAYHRDNIMTGYGEQSLVRLKAASEKYDPEGMFQKGVPGGFKLFE
ncbi:hypothetical protein B0H66DRAFT_621733 [Apodospora peruviana]|uniref:Uncharacterized protein n=1 Tax=Apodospora peruviana TaxID=516989 RepID=A0AAE0M464_9PEZI|nr:hypothetical protein B0H66DRAFT_621733 [Apodospora peruviana]